MTQEPPVLRYREGSIVVPGDRLGTIRQARRGIGTYVRGGHIYACLLGKLTIEKVEASVDDTEIDEHKEAIAFVCSVESSKPPATSQVLKIGQKVVGKVIRITPQNATVEIMVAENVGPLRMPYFEGVVRSEDIRSFSVQKKAESQAPLLVDSFRPGDLVACRIISMGDARRYFLTTAETELGVIRAQRKGVTMVPVSWKEMECPETGIREPRKCAKPLMVEAAGGE